MSSRPHGSALRSALPAFGPRGWPSRHATPGLRLLKLHRYNAAAVPDGFIPCDVEGLFLAGL
jgi:hypothetical protein